MRLNESLISYSSLLFEVEVLKLPSCNSINDLIFFSETLTLWEIFKRTSRDVTLGRCSMRTGGHPAKLSHDLAIEADQQMYRRL